MENKETFTREMLADCGLEPGDSRHLDVFVSDLFDAGYRKEKSAHSSRPLLSAKLMAAYVATGVGIWAFLLGLGLGLGA